MAISDIAAYANLSSSDVEAIGVGLDRIRSDVEESLGAKDAAYIRRTIVFQRTLDAAARRVIAGTRSTVGWLIGASAQWRYSHNYRHHVFSNVLGVDDDLGFGVLRVTRDQPWKREHLLQPLRNMLLAVIFEWGIARHDYHSDRVLRNLWTYAVTFCGHFPDGVQHFEPEVLQRETKAEWCLRQMLGAANFKAGRLLAFSSGNLCYQIEHHLFPDLPSNRYAQIGARVRELCDKYDIAYITGTLPVQYLQTVRTTFRLALPDPAPRR
ncbi:MAG: acyl-CoA desaturase [Mycobacterium sp.]